MEKVYMVCRRKGDGMELLRTAQGRECVYNSMAQAKACVTKHKRSDESRVAAGGTPAEFVIETAYQ